MPAELWGTLSVADHLDTRALVADVLLFDRLIIPCPPPIESEIQRWVEKGWKPRAQANILRKIEGLYEPIFWNDERQKRFSARFRGSSSTLPTLADAVRTEIDAYQDTRDLLKEELGFKLLEEYKGLRDGVTSDDIKIMPVYRSPSAFFRDFIISTDPEKTVPSKERQATEERDTHLYHFIAHQLEVPAEEDDEKALEKAVNLARNERYQRRRRMLYDKVDERVQRRGSPGGDRRVIQDYLAEVNEIARDESESTRKRWVVTCAKALLGGAQTYATGDPTGILGGVLEVMTQVIEEPQGLSSGPCAMFHDVLEEMEWKRLGVNTGAN